MTPPTLKAKEFENLLLEGARRHEKQGVLSMDRYGVQVSMIDGKWVPVPSLPDFDGILMGGQQFIIEAKVCSGSAFPMQKVNIKPKQVRHMLRRASFGALCFLIIHFNERRLVRSHHPGETIAIPVNHRFPGWQSFLDGEAVSAISRDAASRMGSKVEWTAPKGSRKHLPNLAELLGVSFQNAPCPATEQGEVGSD